MSEWKPIETAPKGNERVLTFGGGLVGTSRYVTTFAEAYRDYGGPGWYSEQLDRRHEPTHWMPLPNPPQS